LIVPLFYFKHIFFTNKHFEMQNMFYYNFSTMYRKQITTVDNGAPDHTVNQFSSNFIDILTRIHANTVV
jgi:hypothetical protein